MDYAPTPSAGLRTLALMIALLVGLPAAGQSDREIATIASLGQQEIAQREARAAAQAEREHRERLEEATRLRQIYQQYLGRARRAALKVAEAKHEALDWNAVEAQRREARTVIDEVTDATKQRVREELDPIYAELEAAIVPTIDEMFAADPQLREMRQQLAGGSGRQLDWVDETAIQYAICSDSRQQEVIASNVEFREELSNDEALGIDLCNRRRLVLGLNPLAVDMKLVECSRDHSNDMKTLGFFAHNSPVEGKTTPWDRARNFSTTASGENIAAGYGSGVAATMGWWYSPGHLKNMMGRGHNRVGLGQEDRHYTQMFGR
ncbi:MAG: CAP domain-containing protein [Planctomycetota bacterium]